MILKKQFAFIAFLLSLFVVSHSAFAEMLAADKLIKNTSEQVLKALEDQKELLKKRS